MQTFKILKGHDRVNKDTWFQMAAKSEKATRSTDGLLNLGPKPCRLEVRRNFFSNRVIDRWNKILNAVNNVEPVFFAFTSCDGDSHLDGTGLET